MRTIINSYIKKNGITLKFAKSRYDNTLKIFIRIDNNTLEEIAAYNPDIEVMTLYYKLPWTVMNKIYKYFDEIKS